MTRNDLYDAAFHYKKAGLWKKLWDSDVFAIRLKSGEIGYICIMGKNGEYNALGLYIGEEGFGSYWAMADIGHPTGSPFRDHEQFLQQRCLQAALEFKDNLMPEEVDEVRSYARENGIKLTGKNAYPQFIKYEPGCHPWKVQTKEDTNALYEALVASCLLAEELKTKNPEALGIFSISPDTKEVPLFEVKGDKLVSQGSASLPGPVEVHYDPVIAENEIAVASVKKLQKKGVWDSELVCMMDPAQNSPEEVPFYPMFLMVVDSKSGYLLPLPFFNYQQMDAKEFFQNYANAWKNLGSCPKEIRCRDERTQALLKDFCEKTKVRVSVYKKPMPMLDEAEEAFLERTAGGKDDNVIDNINDVVNAILSMSKEELGSLPKGLVNALKNLIADGVFPRDVAKLLTQKLKDI